MFHNGFIPLLVIAFKDGSVYQGEWKNNKENGQGTHTDITGWKYVGEWKDGVRYGQGRMEPLSDKKETVKYFTGSFS